MHIKLVFFYSQGGGRLKYIEQKEIFASKSTSDSSLTKFRKMSATEPASESLKEDKATHFSHSILGKDRQ